MKEYLKPRKLFDNAYLLLALAVLFWSINFILARALRAQIPPIALAFWRWFIATIILSGFATKQLVKDIIIVRDNFLIIFTLSALGVGAFNTLIYSGMQYSVALNAILLQSVMPVLVVIMSFLLFKQRLNTLQIIAVIISLSGAVFIIIRGNIGNLSSMSINYGDRFFLIAVFCYALYTVLLRQRPKMHPLAFLLATFITGTILILPLYLYEHFMVKQIVFDLPTVLSILYVAIFPSIVSYLFFNRGVDLIGANKAALFSHLMPVYGTLLSVLVLGESFQFYHAVGIALILFGILLISRKT